MPLLETRGVASAKGFGFTAGAKRIVDWTRYLIIPNAPSVSLYTVTVPTRISFLNKDTGTIDFTVQLSSSGISYPPAAKLMRVGDWLYMWGNINTGTVYYFNIITGAYSGALNLTPPGVAGCDIAVIGNNNNPLLPAKVVSANRTEPGALVVTRWIHNNDTGTFTAETTTTLNGVFTSSNQTGSSYSTPQIAPMGTVDTNTGAWTYAGTIGYVGYDDYPGPTYTRWLVINAPYTGSIYTIASNQTSDNFSRPAAATLDYDRAMLATLDNSYMRVASTGSTGNFISVQNNNAYSNGYIGAALAGASGSRLMLVMKYDLSGSDYLRNYWLLWSGGISPSLLQSEYTFGYNTNITTVVQQGHTTTESVWTVASFAFNGINNVEVFRFSSTGGLTNYFPNLGALSGCMVDGSNYTSRIVNYGA